jgi:hypothetical protein
MTIFDFKRSAGFWRIDTVVHALFLLLGNVSLSLSDMNTYCTVRSEFVPGGFGPRGKGIVPARIQVQYY